MSNITVVLKVVIEEPTLGDYYSLFQPSSLGPFGFGDQFSVTTLESGKHELLMPCLLEFMDVLITPKKKPK